MVLRTIDLGSLKQYSDVADDGGERKKRRRRDESKSNEKKHKNTMKCGVPAMHSPCISKLVCDMPKFPGREVRSTSRHLLQEKFEIEIKNRNKNKNRK